MTRVYIDFDSTLYDTEKLRIMLKSALADEIIKVRQDISKEEIIEKIMMLLKKNSYSNFKVSGILEQEFGFQKNYLLNILINIIARGDDFVYDDSVRFLKNLSQKGYEVNILTYTNKTSYDYQLKKISGSKLADFVDNIIICTKNKGELGLDYKNSYFIDDNPEQLESLFNAGVLENRLIRPRRENAGYSNIEIKKFKTIDIVNFDEIDFL